MKYLGIESSCDETAAAVVEERDGRLYVLSNAVASQIDTHRLYGGVVPEIASRAHTEAISRVVREALEGAGCTPATLDAVAVTSHPGLIGALLVGVNFAKGFAAAYGLPLVPVDHIKAHLATVYLSAAGTPPTPPHLALAASGGHTAIYEVADPLHTILIGTTRDDAIGEAFDKVGRLLGIPYPAGAGFDRLASEGFRRATGESDVRAAYRRFKKCPAYRDPMYRLPSPAMQDGSLDFSFSGLKTAAVNLLHRFDGREGFDRAIFAAAYTYVTVEAVAAQLSAALARYPGQSLAIAGGVAANTHLRARLQQITDRAGVSLCLPPPSLCGDNGAMVGALCHFAYRAGVRGGDDLNASAADED